MYIVTLLEECDVLEKDEQQVDEAVEAGAFQFMRQAVVNSSFFFQEVCPL